VGPAGTRVETFTSVDRPHATSSLPTMSPSVVETSIPEAATEDPQSPGKPTQVTADKACRCTMLMSTPQNSRLLSDFEEHLDDLLRQMIAHEASADIGSPCSCNNGIRTTQCRDCTQYRSSCSKCFLEAHRCMPFHWAYVWDDDLGFFERKDFSALGGTIFL